MYIHIYNFAHLNICSFYLWYFYCMAWSTLFLLPSFCHAKSNISADKSIIWKRTVENADKQMNVCVYISKFELPCRFCVVAYHIICKWTIWKNCLWKVVFTMLRNLIISTLCTLTLHMRYIIKRKHNKNYKKKIIRCSLFMYKILMSI